MLHIWRGWELVNQASEGLLTDSIIQEVDVYLKIPLLEVASAAKTEIKCFDLIDISVGILGSVKP